MKILDFLFRKETQSKPEYDFEADRKLRIERESVIREAWEKSNELAKKHDACNLGMTKTAFSGTYDEFNAIEYSKSLGNLSSMYNAQAQYQGMQGMNAYQGQSSMANMFGGISV